MLCTIIQASNMCGWHNMYNEQVLPFKIFSQVLEWLAWGFHEYVWRCIIFVIFLPVKISAKMEK